MKRIINGKIYDTQTAELICELRTRFYRRDLPFLETALYRSPQGQYFLLGEGGPESIMWVESEGKSSWSGGQDLKLIEAEDAQQHAENANLSEDQMITAGFKITEG